MDARKVIGVFAVYALMALFLMLTSGILGGILGYNKGKSDWNLSIDTVVVTRTDTVTLVERRVDTLTRIVERLRPVAVHDTIIKGDTLYVTLPYESRHYSVPDTLDVWYSGVDPRIDSTRVYVRTNTITVGHFREVTKMPRLTAELGAGAIYIDKIITPYLLGEMRWNQPHTTFSAFGTIDYTGRWGAGVNVTYRINLIK